MFQSKGRETGRAEGELEQRDVSNWTCSGFATGPSFGLHTSDAFMDGHVAGHDWGETQGPPPHMEPHSQWPQVVKKKSTDSGNHGLLIQ